MKHLLLVAALIAGCGSVTTIVTGGDAPKHHRMPIGEVGAAMYELFAKYPAIGEMELSSDPCPNGGMVYRIGHEALYATCGIGKLTVTGKVINKSAGVFESEGQNIIVWHDDEQHEVLCNFRVTKNGGSICGKAYQ